MRTVFVIGAGANKEIGMPVGDELKMQIASLLDLTPNDDGTRNGIIHQALNLHCRDVYERVDTYMLDELFDTAINVSKAMPLSSSIDCFIESRRGEQKIELCGKLAIVNAILEAERYCVVSLAYDEKLSREKRDEQIRLLTNSWYPLLFRKIIEGCNINELAARLDNISFMIFNYDRCFEYFMYNALMIYYNMDHSMAREFVEGLHINHPYGTVGGLWDEKDRLAFGKTPDPQELLLLSKRIKTFTESRSTDEKTDSSNRIQYLIERANSIIFLGFAYHDQNLDMLFKHSGVLYVMDSVPMSDHFSCYGTGYGISDNDIDRLRSILKMKDKRMLAPDIQNITCTKFFQDFSYRLSFKDS